MPHAEGLDEAALEELYVRLEKPLYNVAYRWLWDPAEAQEVVQEAFLRLWRKRESVRLPTVEPLIYRIATNLASNRRRTRRLWRWTTLEAVRERPAAGDGAGTRLDRERREALVRAAVEALPERLRRVVVLCEVSDLTYAQVGEILGIPAGTVGSRRNQALALLRGRLRDLAVGGGEGDDVP